MRWPAAPKQLSREARSEQQRRQTAREWKQRQDDRNRLEQGRDLIFGGEDPPVGPPAQPITLTYAQASTTPRQPLEGQSGSGTSSARPANLRSFATNSAGANESLATHPGLLRDAYSSFTSGCGWGSLSADGVWAGFDAYLTANGNDVTWANAVAAGVHAERQDLQIDPPQAYGAPPTTGYANDPVNTATGNFLEPESPDNARLGIDGSGNVAVQGDNVLFPNFGDRPRADAFLEQRLAQGFDGTEIKAFDVPDSYADSIRNRAAPEAQARGNPVFQVDTTRTDSSFGLRSSEFPGLVDAAIPGSGRWWLHDNGFHERRTGAPPPGPGTRSATGTIGSCDGACACSFRGGRRAGPGRGGAGPRPGPKAGGFRREPEAHVPAWFVQACAPEPTAAERERWLAWWRTLDHAGKVVAERERGWTLQEWLSWMEPQERTWWWDAQPTSEFDATIAVEVEGWPTALGALEWLLTASGASTISEPQHG